MAGPWEKYQNKAPAGESRPWTKFQSAPPKAVDTPREGRFSDAAFQGLTLGAGDEIDGVIGAVVDVVKGAFTGDAPEFGEAYDKRLGQARSILEGYRDKNPVKSTIGEVGGALLPALATAGAAAVPTALQAAGTSLAASGIYGFNSGEGGAIERGKNAGVNAVIGGVGGVVAPALVRKFGHSVAKRSVPTVERLKKHAGKLYDAAKRTKISLTPDAFDDILFDLVQTAKSSGVVQESAPKTHNALKALYNRRGESLTINDMDQLRQVLKTAAGNTKAQERFVASTLVSKFDDALENLSPRDVIGGSPKKAVETLKRARQAWGKAKKAETIFQAVDKAVLRTASTGSGGNVNNAIRQNLTSILVDAKKRRGFSKEELRAMRSIVEGTHTQNALRLVGKLSPSGNGLALMAQVFGATATMNPVFLAPGLVGAGAKFAADRTTGKAAQKLMADAARGGQPVNKLLTQSQRAALPGAAAGTSIVNSN